MHESSTSAFLSIFYDTTKHEVIESTTIQALALGMIA
jgi:hypothetical protein